jgi:hypothetical protein
MPARAGSILIGIAACLAVWGPVAADQLYPPRPSSCLACHADKTMMRSLGHPGLYVGGDHIVAQESAMVYWANSLEVPRCVSCHLGNPRDYSLTGAHRGLLGPWFMLSRKRVLKRRRQLSRGERKQVKVLRPTGPWDVAWVPKFWDASANKWKYDPALYMVLWHDHNPRTAAYNPLIAAKTCGHCHPNETSSFSRSPMGAGEYLKGVRETVTQPQYTDWLAGTGPHSCGIWIGKLAEPDLAAFSPHNLERSNRVMTRKITPLMMAVTQRNCNKCHVGCLDCHYYPGRNSRLLRPGHSSGTFLNDVYGDPQKTYGGVHRMVRRPTVLSCMGGGRGYVCHAGPLERRRGDGYVRGSLAMPPWDPQAKDRHQDVHYVNGVQCIDCHTPDFARHGHSALVRDPAPQACRRCHPRQVEAWQRGKHKKVRCEACHTSVVFGYGWNFWVPGQERGIKTTIARHSAYQKGAIAPILIPDPEGMWAPYNPIPHIAANIRPEAFRNSRLQTQMGLVVYRSAFNRHGRPLGLHGAKITRAYRSSDAFVVTALYPSRVNPGNEGHVMAWIALEKVAHLTSGRTHKSRSCRSCHTPTGQQQAQVSFRWLGQAKHMYQDVHHGQYLIVADKLGIRVVNFQAFDEQNRPAKGLTDKAEVFRSRPMDLRIKPVKPADLAVHEAGLKRFLAGLKMARRIVRAATIRRKDFAFQAAVLLDRAKAEVFHGDLKKGLVLLDKVLALRNRL